MMFPKPGGKKKGQKSPKQQAEDTAWRWFSKFIRLRDCDGSEYGHCFTCGKLKHWKDLHAGHFQSSGYPSTKFDEKNVHIQCVKCNTYLEGQKDLYAINLDKKYGKGTAQSLQVKAKLQRGSFALGEVHFRKLADVYRLRFKKLEKQL